MIKRPKGILKVNEMKKGRVGRRAVFQQREGHVPRPCGEERAELEPSGLLCDFNKIMQEGAGDLHNVSAMICSCFEAI